MPTQRGPLVESLSSRFGGRRELLRHIVYTSLMHLGYFHKYHVIDWSRVERLVFVCKGNICRSAYAEARTSVCFPAASFGVGASCGAAADANTITHAIARNVSLSHHRTTPMEAFRQQPGDLLVCMEPPQVEIVKKRFADSSLQVTLLGLWARPSRPWLSDPYGNADGYWRRCLDTIDSGIDQMLALISGQKRPSQP